MTRKAVVTGGTRGIGFHVAKQLRQQGFAVTIVGQDPHHGAEAVRAIGGDTRFLRADLTSLSEVRALGARLAGEGPLQLLVNNVGGQFSTRWMTADGIEASFALNHLSPTVLTDTLLDALKAGAPSRIIEVSSSSITVATHDDLPTYEDIEQDGPYYGMVATGRAKLAHLALALDLAEELQGSGISVLVVDPIGPAAAATPNGLAMTPDLLPPSFRDRWDEIQAGLLPVDHGAPPIVAAATDPAFDGVTGVVLGPDAAPCDDLRKFVTPEIAESARVLTRRVLAISRCASWT